MTLIQSLAEAMGEGLAVANKPSKEIVALVKKKVQKEDGKPVFISLTASDWGLNPKEAKSEDQAKALNAAFLNATKGDGTYKDLLPALVGKKWKGTGASEPGSQAGMVFDALGELLGLDMG
jgi:hypothetical protein